MTNEYNAPISELTVEGFYAGMALMGMISRFDDTPPAPGARAPEFNALMALQAWKIGKLMVDVGANESNRRPTRPTP